MRFAIVLLAIGQALASTYIMPNDWIVDGENSKSITADASEFEKYYEQILDTQGKALDQISLEENSKGLFAFQMNEMKTNLSVSRSGIFGLSAYKAKKALEITWKKRAIDKNYSSENEHIITVPAEATEMDLKKVSDEIVAIARSSKKIKNLKRLEDNINRTLNRTNSVIKNFHLTHYGAWALDSLRLDLNLGVDGSVWVFTKFGIKVRVRLEWSLKKMKVDSLKVATSNAQSKFVSKVLADLDKAVSGQRRSGFKIKKVNVGIGMSHKGGFFGMWKSSYGFLGFLRFVPVRTKAIDQVNLALIPENDDYSVGENSESSEKGLISRIFLRRKSFRTGMTKTMQTTEFFANAANKPRSQQWYVAELKTISSVTRSGFFGLSSVSTDGVVEVELKRK